MQEKISSLYNRITQYLNHKKQSSFMAVILKFLARKMNERHLTKKLFFLHG